MSISIQEADFDQGNEYQSLAKGNEAGAVVTFVGRVRDFTENTDNALFLEHYPGMTEKVLQKILDRANSRWELIQTRIIHRIGSLPPGEQIVFVGVSSAHRKAAFEACQFIMDILKTEAPFWKREGENWVEAKSTDDAAAKRWLD